MQSDATQDAFSQGVASLLMAVEELRGAVVSYCDPKKTKRNNFIVLEWHRGMEGLLHHHLEPLARWTADTAGGASEITDLFRHCHDKTVNLCQFILEKAFELAEVTDDDDEEDDNRPNSNPVEAIENEGEHGWSVADRRRTVQGTIARLTELGLVLLERVPPGATQSASSQSADELVTSYVAYQRQVLRQRVKPAIAALVQQRKMGTFQNPSPTTIQQHHDDDDDDDNDEEPAVDPSLQQHHAPALTAVLGQAAALIHPLLAWQVNLPDDSGDNRMVYLLRRLTNESIQTLNEQAQTLVQTVLTWLAEDLRIDPFLEQAAAATPIQDSDNEEDPLGALDRLVDEMALVCQVQARYQGLVSDIQLDTNLLQQELAPEWTWKYASLERYLGLLQWKTAVRLAAPVSIVLGTAVQVPSVVEDAQYLSTRALTRAASTRSAFSVGTVAHAMSNDVWSVDNEEQVVGVHRALLEQKGCWKEELDTQTPAEAAAAPSRNDFAAALLDALDEDLGGKDDKKTGSGAASPKRGANSASRTPPAPSSGTFLSKMMLLGNGGSAGQAEQRQLDAHFCVLNGIFSASGACRALVVFLEGLTDSGDQEQDGEELDTDALIPDEKASAMIHLAREDLSRYADAYHAFLIRRTDELLAAYCGEALVDLVMAKRGCCFHELTIFFVRESYDLDQTLFQAAEADERLHTELERPLQESVFLQQLSEKCEATVLATVMRERIATAVVDLVLEALWNSHENDNVDSRKRMTDWGSLLFSKQTRLLQTTLNKLMTTSATGAERSEVMNGGGAVQVWERLDQVVTILQQEKPSDWVDYYQSTSILTADEVEQTMRLRVEFSTDAIQSVVSTLRQKE